MRRAHPSHSLHTQSGVAPALSVDPTPTTRKAPELLDWLGIVRLEVDAHLIEFFEDKKRETEAISPPTLELVDEIGALTMRGGKRLRPAVAAAGYRCVRPGHGMERLVELSASLELLQSYLLIHDDWMDGDEVRRGGTAVHTSLQQRHGNPHLGSALGVLAGDLASAYAWELFLEAPYPRQSWPDACAMFLQIQKQVYCGQQLDLVGDADVARMHALKTTSYSVRGPLLLGALLGNPNAKQLRALTDWAKPIGEAFQIRDDLLGALGSADSTGKPGMDIPHGKVSSVLSELRRSTRPKDREPVEAIVGRIDVDARQLEQAHACLRALGVVDRLERSILELRDQALRALERGAFNPQGRGMLTELADKLTVRRA
jgi:geranylgeranyl diphosphate synthase type I